MKLRAGFAIFLSVKSEFLFLFPNIAISVLGRSV